MKKTLCLMMTSFLLLLLLSACSFIPGEEEIWQGESEHWHLRYNYSMTDAGTEQLEARLKYKKRINLLLIDSNYHHVQDPPISIYLTTDYGDEMVEQFLNHDGSVQFLSTLCCFNQDTSINVTVTWNGKEESFKLTRK